MPLKEIDYIKTQFYKIVCKGLSVKDCYVGHTTNFNTRKGKHRFDCNYIERHNYNIPVYQFIRENGGFDSFDMILIKTDFCEHVLEARRKERDYIEQLNATLNTVKRPYTSKEEKEETFRHWYGLNRESQNEKKKQYAEIHKEALQEYR